MNIGRVSNAALMLSGVADVLLPTSVASALVLTTGSTRAVAVDRPETDAAFWSYLAAEIGFGATALASANS